MRRVVWQVRRVCWGRAASPTFDLYAERYFGLRDPDELCFSLELVPSELRAGRWLDLAAPDHAALKLWYLGLSALVGTVGTAASVSAAALSAHLEHGLGLSPAGGAEAEAAPAERPRPLVAEDEQFELKVRRGCTCDAAPPFAAPIGSHSYGHGG